MFGNTIMVLTLRTDDSYLSDMDSVLLKDVANNEVVIGNPSELMEDYGKWLTIKKSMIGKTKKSLI